MRKANSIISMIIVFLIIFTTLMPGLAMSSYPKTVHIASAQDLVQLSEDCSFDHWSQGITVFLDNDIDLKGVDFLPIPIFGGTFDGQGHTINGLSITVEGSNQGLFRYLQEGAVIKNLSVEGIVAPIGDKSTVGGIVGNNKGLLENCNFLGSVNGKDTVGGIIGWNSTSGMIINCSFNGIIYGESKVGGIAGYNAGTLLRCSNYSSVNTTVEDQKLGLEDITMDNISFKELFVDAIDIGGIAGINTGIVQNSENHGIVGYPHVGYNIGGIVGRQSGYITSCSNHGKIYGRKEVAGIAGQIEPHISSKIKPSKLKNLQRELNALDSSITKLISDGKVTTDLTTDNLLSIQDSIDGSKTHAESLIDQTERMINTDIEEINKLSLIGVEALDRLIPITEDLGKTVEDMGKVIGPIKRSMEYISRMMDESAYLNNKFKKIGSTLEKAIGRMAKDEGKLEESYEAILQIIELLQDGKIDGVDELLLSVLENLKYVSDNIMKEIIALEPLIDDFEDIMGSMDDISRFMTYALDYMIEAMDEMEYTIDNIDPIFKGINNLLTYLSENGDLKFETSDDFYQKTKEDLYGSISDLSSSVSQFIEIIGIEGNILMDDIQAVSDQLFKIMNTMINMIEEITDGDISQEDIVKDVSGDDIDKQTEGKVSDCKNFAAIEGDLNVGGIAGGMSIELLDPEMDLDLKGKLSYNTVFESRAIILRCENTGSIIGKKNHVGGIVGNMALGYIKDCIVSSSIESIDGNYVGGIAGRSDAPIVSSYARTTLNGGNYVGGISGLAKEIINSYTLTKVTKSRACVGAIAGNIDPNSNIKYNYFVSDVLRGIDGISYIDKAEPISYEKLISIENLPNIFKDFKLNFWVDDRIIHTIDFNYGDSISKKDFPRLPPKGGYYGSWEEFDTANLSFDTDIHGIYIPYLTILESEEKRDGILSIVLVEGSFVEGDSISLIQDGNQDPPQEDESKHLEQWNVLIPEDGESNHIIRFLPSVKKKKLEVYILRDEEWVKTESQWDGKYLVFEASGNNVGFSIVESEIPYIKYALFLGIGILIIIISFIYIRGRRKKEAEPA